MTTTLNATTSNGLVVTPDNSGNVLLQYNGASAPAFSVYASTDQTPSTGVWTKINYNTKIFDTNTNFSTANSSFTPTVAGYYQMNSFVTFSSQTATNSDVLLAIYKNGSIYSSVQGRAVDSRYAALTISIVVNANGTTDYFEMFVRSNNAGGYLASNATLGNFSGCLLRGA